MNTHQVGTWGEDAAASHLLRSGWTVLDRNFRRGRREIDLVVRREDTVAFVEVKTRRTGEFGDPLEAIGGRKATRIREVADDWITLYGSDRLEYRFDAIAVTDCGSGECRIRHVVNAWGI